MTKRKTTAQFIEDAKAIHGDKYDYSKVIYTGSCDKIEIICPIHCSFFQSPTLHLQNKGCPICGENRRISKSVGKKKKPQKAYDVGICDILSIDDDGNVKYSYILWRNIMKRCYSDAYHLKQSTYIGIEVDSEWLLYSDFSKWFDENYIEGYEIDKDLLIPKSKIYSPDSCCFIPKELNLLLSRCKKTDKTRNNIGLGVTYNKRGKKFIAQITKYGKHETLGRFTNPADALFAYKTAKEKYIKEVAQEYYDKGLIKQNVYEALMNYEVLIDD